MPSDESIALERIASIAALVVSESDGEAASAFTLLRRQIQRDPISGGTVKDVFLRYAAAGPPPKAKRSRRNAAAANAGTTHAEAANAAPAPTGARPDSLGSSQEELAALRAQVAEAERRARELQASLDRSRRDAASLVTQAETAERTVAAMHARLVTLEKNRRGLKGLVLGGALGAGVVLISIASKSENVAPPSPRSTMAAATSTPPATPVIYTPARPAAPDAMAAAATAFLQGYWTALDGGDTAAAFVAAHYADPVSYYGKATARSAVLTDKLATISRWPVRFTVPVPNTSDLSCDGATKVCKATGVAEFDARSSDRRARSAGTFRYWLTMELRQGVFTITSEASQAIERKG